MINRDVIVQKLKEGLEPLNYVNAMWLEGADANSQVDDYSDLDIYVDINDEHEEQAIEAVENILSALGELDYNYVMNHNHPKLRQRIYHVKGTSEYLMIDFCWQLNSRNKDEYVYIRGSQIEGALVLFDKADIIRYKDYNEMDYTEWNAARLEECRYRYSQHCRVMKYVHRGLYLEAYGYYNRYVFQPLIDLLRLIYTPAHADYYLVHISHHIPRPELEKLEFFAKVTSLEDIEARIPLAQSWFLELTENLTEAM